MDAEFLTNIIDSSALTKTEIAEQLGLTRQGLYDKLNQKTEFKSSEIKTLSRVLNLSREQRDRIFFNDFVDDTANDLLKQMHSDLNLFTQF
ncbi:MAG: XRE family transcriptional regulator [Ruminococcus sp.]|nr:XRE family transcriptional regulator [Ruminococcus sp.]